MRVLSQGLLDTGIVDRNKFATVDDVIAERAYAAFLHASHEPLARHGRARCGDYRDAHAPLDDQGARAVAHVAGGHDADHRAGFVHSRRRRRARTLLRTSASGSRTTRSSRPTGCELITRDVPVDADEIEALMRDARTPRCKLKPRETIGHAPPRRLSLRYRHRRRGPGRARACRLAGEAQRDVALVGRADRCTRAGAASADPRAIAVSHGSRMMLEHRSAFPPTPRRSSASTFRSAAISAAR